MLFKSLETTFTYGFKLITVMLKVYILLKKAFLRFKGDISRFFVFLCNFLLCVGFYVFIKKSVHFPQFSVIKWV